MSEAKTVQSNRRGELCPSGIEGLDDILGGGLPRNCFYQNLKQESARYHSTVPLSDDKIDSNQLGADPQVLSITHGVIEMEQLSPDYGISRRGLHFREFKLETGTGVLIGPPLKEFQGVLTGVPMYHGTRERILNAADATQPDS